MKNTIIALIVTNNKRPLKQALCSILAQKRKADFIYVANESRKHINFDARNLWNNFLPGLARNTMSALLEIFLRHGENVFVATLDDDDYWLENYLLEAEELMDSKNFICTWVQVKKNNLKFTEYKFKPQDLTIRKFVLENIGVQGSNKIFHLGLALESGGMFKQSNAATDRAFNINILKHPETKIGVVQNCNVIYNEDDNRNRISNNLNRKQDLIEFYKAIANHITISDIKTINKRHKILHGFAEDIIVWK